MTSKTKTKKLMYNPTNGDVKITTVESDSPKYQNLLNEGFIRIANVYGFNVSVCKPVNC